MYTRVDPYILYTGPRAPGPSPKGQGPLGPQSPRPKGPKSPRVPKGPGPKVPWAARAQVQRANGPQGPPMRSHGSPQWDPMGAPLSPLGLRGPKLRRPRRLRRSTIAILQLKRHFYIKRIKNIKKCNF